LDSNLKLATTAWSHSSTAIECISQSQLKLSIVRSEVSQTAISLCARRSVDETLGRDLAHRKEAANNAAGVVLGAAMLPQRRVAHRCRWRWIDSAQGKQSHVAGMREMWYLYEVSAGKPEGQRPLGRCKSWLEENVKLDLKDTGYQDEDWIHLTSVNKVMNLRVS
jgi:hypothetical protein